ncbi:hypothetical protein D3C84_1160520 [compost metagenome]
MLADRIDRGKYDCRQGRADRQVREDRRIEPLQLETVNQHRNDNDPAADAEQPGQHTCAGAERQIEQKFHAHPQMRAAW